MRFSREKLRFHDTESEKNSDIEETFTVMVFQNLNMYEVLDNNVGQQRKTH